jgi:hypothetical protein
MPDGILKPGTGLCQCAACDGYFGSVRGFDRHRVGPQDARRCLTPDEIAATGLSRDARGIWRQAPPKMARLRAGVGLNATGDADREG